MCTMLERLHNRPRAEGTKKHEVEIRSPVEEQLSSPSAVDDHEFDRVISEELLRLSFRERTKIHEEMHGVDDTYPASKDTPEAVEKALRQLQKELESFLLSNKETSGLRPEHLPQNRALRLAFLRCELFDVGKAARRFATYVRVVRGLSANGGSLAGSSPESLGGSDGDFNGGRIRASVWFTAEEYAALKKGSIQMMPYRDQSGRRVMICWSSAFNLKAVTRLKIVLYLVSGASEDVESQKKGFVVLIWPGACRSIRPSLEGLLVTLRDRKVAIDVQMALPLRLVCFHFGYESTHFASRLKNFFVKYLQQKTRMNIITGTITELNYKIMGFGINPVLLPVAGNGMIKTKNHVQWIKGRERIEREPYGSPICDRTTGRPSVDCPGVHDVLFHRGKFCQYHPGNIAFRDILESRKDRHRNANQTAKREIGWEIVQEVESRSGRFLRWDTSSGWWVEFTDRMEIRHKVATSLRDFDKRSRARGNLQDYSSTTHSETDSGFLFLGGSQEQRRKRMRIDAPGDESSDSSCGGFRCR